MARTNKYWESEEPVVTTTPGNVVKSYPKAGALQVYGTYTTGGDPTPKLSKGVTFNLDKMDDLQLNQFEAAIKLAVHTERLLRPKK